MSNKQSKNPLMMILGLIFVPSIIAILVLTAMYFINKDWVSFLDFLPFLDFTDDTKIKLMPFRKTDDKETDIRSGLSKLSTALGTSESELVLTSEKPADEETPDLIIQKVTIKLDDSSKDMWKISDDGSFKEISTTGMTKDALEEADVEVHVLVLATVVDAAKDADDAVADGEDTTTERLPVFSVVMAADGTTPKTYTKAGAASAEGLYNKLQVGPFTVDDLEDDGNETDAKYMLLEVPVTKKGGWDITDPNAPVKTPLTTVVDSIILRFEVDELPDEDDA